MRRGQRGGRCKALFSPIYRMICNRTHGLFTRSESGHFQGKGKSVPAVISKVSAASRYHKLLRRVNSRLVGVFQLVSSEDNRDHSRQLRIRIENHVRKITWKHLKFFFVIFSFVFYSKVAVICQGSVAPNDWKAVSTVFFSF